MYMRIYGLCDIAPGIFGYPGVFMHTETSRKMASVLPHCREAPKNMDHDHRRG